MEENELKAIEEIRKRFQKDVDDMEPDLYEDNFFFYRFLKAREFNIDKTEEMIRKHLEWRKANDIKNTVKNFKMPEVIEKYCPYKTIGFDKEGCIVRFAPVGNLDLNGLLLSLKFDEIVKTGIYEIENCIEILKEQSQKYERNVDKFFAIADFGNLSFATVSNKGGIQLFFTLSRLCMDNYPERLKAVYVINASFYFTFALAVIKSVIPAGVMKKLHVYSDDSYKNDLLELIDADELPAFLGGNKTDPDGNPLCLTFGLSHSAEPVPESYYMKKKKRSLSKLPGVKKATLSRAEFQEVKLEVTESGSYLEWEFETKCRDIGFGLFYEEIIDGEEKITELVPIQRLDTEAYPETGSVKCENLGTYVIVFDNTYSWIRGKEIYYRAKITSPKENEYENEFKH